MQSDYWLERWQTGEIGFHRGDFSAHLLKFWPSLNVPPPAQVLVPLCGKSLDMHWLSQQGYAVLGVELSPLAIAAFFTEAGLQPVRSRHGRFECWQAGNIRILCGDIFDLSAADSAGCSLIYDRAALIALPENLRARYAAHLRQLFAHPVQVLLEVLCYPQEDTSGPPFSVEPKEVKALFPQADIRLLHEQDILAQEPRFRSRGVTRLWERVYALRWAGP